MFSLGCVILEILSLHRRGSLQILRAHREANPAYHANIDHLSTWLKTEKTEDNNFSRIEHYLESEIRLMLSTDPKCRPKAIELLYGIIAQDSCPSYASMPSMFGDCCKRTVIPHTLFRQMVHNAAEVTHTVKVLTKQLDEAKEERARNEDRTQQLYTKLADSLNETHNMRKKLSEAEHTRDAHKKDSQAYREAFEKSEKNEEELIAELIARRLSEDRRSMRNQDVYRTIKEYLLETSLVIAELSGRANHHEHTCGVEDTDLSRPVLKQSRSEAGSLDYSSTERLTSSAKSTDSFDAINSYMAIGFPRQKLATIHEHHVLHLASPERESPHDSQEPYQTPNQVEYPSYTSSLYPLYPQSDQGASSEGSGTKGKKPRVDILKAFANGVKAGLTPSKGASRQSYEEGMTTEEASASSGGEGDDARVQRVSQGLHLPFEGFVPHPFVDAVDFHHRQDRERARKEAFLETSN